MSAEGQQGGAAAIGEETEVADADKAGGQQVEKEAAQELIGGQRHESFPVAVSGVPRISLQTCTRETLYRAFGGRVSRNPALAGVSLDGCENNDAAPSALLHLRDAEVRRQVGAIDVHRHAAVPSLGVGFERRAERMNGRRVGQYVESAESGNSLFDQSFYIGGLRYVATLHFQAKAVCFCVSRQLRIGGSFNAAGHHLGSALR